MFNIKFKLVYVLKHITSLKIKENNIIKKILIIKIIFKKENNQRRTFRSNAIENIENK